MLASAAFAAALASFPLADVETNVCNLVWNYCPRDPGCVTYTMSVHDVHVRDENITAAVRQYLAGAALVIVQPSAHPAAATARCLFALAGDGDAADPEGHDRGRDLGRDLARLGSGDG